MSDLVWSSIVTAGHSTLSMVGVEGFPAFALPTPTATNRTKSQTRAPLDPVIGLYQKGIMMTRYHVSE